MKCLNKAALTHYFDKQLPDNRMEAIKDHLVGCPVCMGLLQTVREEAELVTGKLELLKPQIVPDVAFSPAGAAKRSGILTMLKEFIASTVRVPAPAMAFLLGVILLMGAVLFIQGRKISQLKSPLAAAKQQTTLYLVSNTRIQSVSLDADLEGFEPIKKPKIFVSKENKQ